jgi:DNA-binding HxlR family transcriptional regulator
MQATKARDAVGSASGMEECESSNDKGLCPVLVAIGVIGTEWRLAIIHRLLEGPQRFSAILKSNPNLNAKTLSATLKFLENQGVVQRKVISDRPFQVQYSLTDVGMGLAPAAQELKAWGIEWIRSRRQANARTPAVRRPSTIQGELPRVVIEKAADAPYAR